MASREDDDYWNTKYAEASCYVHGSDEMWHEPESGEWVCMTCEDDDEDGRTYTYG